MKNREVADLLDEIADLLEMKDVEWKPRAYRKAARNIASLEEPVEDIHARGELEEIDGVGEAISEKVAEYLETGELQYYRELREELPVDIDSLTAVEGVGPKTAQKLHQELGIENLDDLEEAAEKGRIAEIEGFGEKKQQRILDHIEFARQSQERMLLGKAQPVAMALEKRLENMDSFRKVEVVGSFRRRKPTVGDLDVLATASRRKEAMKEFCGMDDVKEVLNQGETKSSVIVSGGLQVDLRIVEESSWGAALVYFTGSREHNVKLRSIAIDQGKKLNEYGLYREEEMLAGKTEEEVYRELDLQEIPPELREDLGEVEAAQENRLPDLLEPQDLKGDLQLHTDYSDGSATVEEMVAKAEKLGHEYMLVTDHGPSLAVAQGPENVEELEEQREEIEKADEKFDVEVLQGMEANVTEDGIDISEEMMEMLDLLVLAMHNPLENPTERLIEAFKEYPVDVFAHPLNRKLNERPGQELDLDRVVKAAEENHVALEINSHPRRLDLPWELVKKYRGDVKFVVSTDAHSPRELELQHFGVSQARKGWLEKKDVLNTRKLEELMEYFRG